MSVHASGSVTAGYVSGEVTAPSDSGAEGAVDLLSVADPLTFPWEHLQVPGLPIVVDLRPLRNEPLASTVFSTMQDTLRPYDFAVQSDSEEPVVAGISRVIASEETSLSAITEVIGRRLARAHGADQLSKLCRLADDVSRTWSAFLPAFDHPDLLERRAVWIGRPGPLTTGNLTWEIAPDTWLIPRVIRRGERSPQAYREPNRAPSRGAANAEFLDAEAGSSAPATIVSPAWGIDDTGETFERPKSRTAMDHRSEAYTGVHILRPRWDPSSSVRVEWMREAWRLTRVGGFIGLTMNVASIQAPFQRVIELLLDGAAGRVVLDEIVVYDTEVSTDASWVTVIVSKIGQPAMP